ncbi:hypothetical protein [Paenibacillus bouchesdurhonensis]|uniref:hypothetical protein n=1 Tax=Paenibacillus bouchesdurhonensis TaxID=1870990 RepID=UPI000DA62A19|nr:hypothetical protein [Paenibacillus bouchesdurhonensis]
MKETIKQLNEQMDYISQIFEDGKIGSVIYNSYSLVHQIATDALQQLTEKDEENKQLMTIAQDWQRQCVQALVERDKLRRALEEAVRKYETGDMESDFADILDGMYETCKGALGEGDKE